MASSSNVHYVYILRCGDDSLYIGETSNLHHRLAKHNEGTGSTFTRARRPVVIVYSETHTTREMALARERQLKRWTRAKKDALIAGDRALLKRL
jgi:predicted GIY-YIG superfamily endonuclease